jgi:hypothetical protein
MQPSVARPDPLASTSPASLWRLGELFRDIARGGLAGLLAGILVAGIGGRVAMRMAALLVPEAAGQFTENGNRIGEVTLGGTLGLVLGGGLFFGLFGATVWVVVSRWIPGGAWTRALLAMPIAVALTGVSLIQATNPDFQVLRHNTMTVVLLLAIPSLAGLAIASFDHWLDRRLPRAGVSATADGAYLALALAGGALIFPIVVASYLGAELPLGLALFGCGLATLANWRVHLQRRPRRPAWLVVAGRGSLLAAVILGALAVGPDVAVALGAP